MHNNFFIGYGTIEEMLSSSKATNEQGVIFISRSIETRPAQFYLKSVHWFVTAAFINANICHYWQMAVGSYATIDGKPAHGSNSAVTDCEKRAASLISVVEVMARNQRFSVVNGLISFPAENLLIEGSTTSIVHDKKTNEFSVRETVQKVRVELTPKLKGGTDDSD